MRFRSSSKPRKPFKTRSGIIAVALLVLATFCFGQLMRIQLFEGHAIAQAATANRTWKTSISAKRGKILDTNGTVLAQSVERYTIVANPQAAQEFTPTPCTKKTQSYCQQLDGKPLTTTGAAAVAQLLAPLLDMNPVELGGKLSGAGQYVVLKKDVTPMLKRRISALHLGGIVYGELSNERVYSSRNLMGALMGGVDGEGKGVAGLEQMMDKPLTGKDGFEVYQHGNGGEEIPGTMTESQPAQDGQDVKLTIDRDVQWRVEQILQDAQKKYSAKWGIAVVQDVATGEILALADTDGYKAGSQDAKLHVARSVNEVFEPGSIGKVFTLAGLIQERQHDIGDQFVVPDHITLDDQTYSDSFTHGDEHWTMAGILEQSSNVGTVMASNNYTDEQRYQYLTKFGIGQESGLKLPGESQGMLRPALQWDARTRNTILFGQGYSTNALQLTNAVAVIANKGVKKPQKIIKSTIGANGHEEQTQSAEGVRVVDETTASKMMNAMESVSEHYASQGFAGVNGYRIAAKSGTAEVAGDDGRLTSIISDYSAIIPADNPRFVVTVVLKDPSGGYGGLTAGPVNAQIGQFLMQKYEVPNSAPRKDAIPVEW